MDLVEFVYASDEVRSALGEISRSGLTWSEVEERGETYEESVMVLVEKGLVRFSDGRLEPTATGEALSGMVERMRGTSDVLEEGGDFWTQRDLSSLPDPFLRRLHRLEGSDFVRADFADLERAMDQICEEVRGATELSIVYPVGERELLEGVESSISEGCRVRGLVSRRPGISTCRELFGECRVRANGGDFLLGVTCESLVLSLPVSDGEEPFFDHAEVLVSGSEESLEWGRELFEHLWDGAGDSGG